MIEGEEALEERVPGPILPPRPSPLPPRRIPLPRNGPEGALAGGTVGFGSGRAFCLPLSCFLVFGATGPAFSTGFAGLLIAWALFMITSSVAVRPAGCTATDRASDISTSGPGTALAMGLEGGGEPVGGRNRGPWDAGACGMKRENVLATECPSESPPPFGPARDVVAQAVDDATTIEK